MKEEKTLREVIREALGNQWTLELEDKLFWPLSYFCNDACNTVKEQALKAVRETMGVKQ